MKPKEKSIIFIISLFNAVHILCFIYFLFTFGFFSTDKSTEKKIVCTNVTDISVSDGKLRAQPLDLLWLFFCIHNIFLLAFVVCSTEKEGKINKNKTQIVINHVFFWLFYLS